MTTTTPRVRSQTATKTVQARPAKQRRLSGALVFALCAALIAAVGMLYLMQTSHVASLGYELSRLQAEQSRESLTNQQLAAEIAELQSLDRAESTARNALGMQPMEEFAYLNVSVPAELELPRPEPSGGDERGLVERTWDRLMGSGSARDGQESAP